MNECPEASYHAEESSAGMAFKTPSEPSTFRVLEPAIAGSH